MKFLAWFSVVWTCAVSGCSDTNTPGSADPIGFTFRTTADSFASFGWTGSFHHIVEPVGTVFGVKVTRCDGDVCRFEGPIDVTSSVNRRRCLFQMSKTCNADSDCPQSSGAPTPCVYIYDPPLATPLKGVNSKVGACGWSYIPIAGPDQPATIRGTLNLTSNALDLDNLTVLLALNSGDPTNLMIQGTFNGLCAECVGDPKPDDGLKQGRCMTAMYKDAGEITESRDLGMPCDVNRYGTDQPHIGGYSMDCSPTLTGGGQPLSLGGQFSSSGFEVEITEASPNCMAGGKCFCGMCSDGATACSSDKPCSSGICSNPAEPDCDPNPIPPAMGYDMTLAINQCRKPPTDPKKMLVAGNQCKSSCTWDESKSIGTCESNLPDPTNTSEDLTVYCYPSGVGAKIAAQGRAEPNGHVILANTANARCIPAGASPQLNSQLGLPGLLFQKRNFEISPAYAEDHK
jgi:hypothetical protein